MMLTSSNILNTKILLILILILSSFTIGVSPVFADVDWAETHTTDPSKGWYTGAMSDDGQTILAGVGGGSGRLYLSTNGGTSWAETQPAGNVNKFWETLRISGDGQTMLAGIGGGRIYLSTNGGTNWAETQPAGVADKVWISTVISDNGQIMLAGVNGGRIYLSTNGGTNWAETQPKGNVNGNWKDIAMSDNGQTISVTESSTRIYLSTNGGTNWAETQPKGDANGSWKDIAMSDNGQTISVSEDGGRAYISTNGGTNWTETQPKGDASGSWQAMSMTDNGQIILIGDYDGRLYLTTNSGTSWYETRPNGDNSAYWQVSGISSSGDSILASGYQSNLYLGNATSTEAPTGLTATVSSGSQIDLSWTAPENTGGGTITSYKIERESPTGGGFADLIADTGDTNTTYSDTGLDAGTEYNYRVSAINAYGTSTPSNEDSSTTYSAPDAPTGLTVSAISETQIDLSWTAPVDNGGLVITGYKIERESPSGNGFSNLIADTGSTDTTYSNTGLTAGTEYNYRVSAINSLGAGTASDAASATTSSTPAPSTPSGGGYYPPQTKTAQLNSLLGRRDYKEAYILVTKYPEDFSREQKLKVYMHYLISLMNQYISKLQALE